MRSGLLALGLVGALGLLFTLLLPQWVQAHEMRPAYLEIREISPDTYDVLWKVPARGGTERLRLDPKFADDAEVLTEVVGGFMAGAYV